MQIFEMLVGVAGAGKSTFAQLQRQSIEDRTGVECVICSSDAIRGELWGDESDQREPNKVFQVMLARTRKALSEGKSVIYDAANIEEKYRVQILQQIYKFDCKKICDVFITKPETCIARQSLRARKVPEYVIWRQIKKFQTPNYYEGWDEIHVIIEAFSKEEFNEEVNKLVDFDQHNPHHIHNLMDHQWYSGQYAKDKEYQQIVIDAAFLHDFGKIYTQIFDEAGVAHYYNHENVSAYFYFLLTNQSSDDAIDSSWLIAHHMDFFKDEKYMKKLRTRAGERLYTALERLHKCDVESH